MPENIPFRTYRSVRGSYLVPEKRDNGVEPLPEMGAGTGEKLQVWKLLS